LATAHGSVSQLRVYSRMNAQMWDQAEASPVAERNHEDAPQEEWTSDQNIDDQYEILNIVGEGAYGTVHRARNTMTGEIVAIKQLHIDDGVWGGIPAHVIREVSLLRDFEHPNIVRLIDVRISGAQDYDLIFEYLERDLFKVLRDHRRAGVQMRMEHVLRYSHQLLSGLQACHVRLILHRDLKPQNLLIGKDGLKIGDFGLARIFRLEPNSYTHDAVTLWYRAPEILLGSQQYGTSVDIWSAGCIIAEMAVDRPIFAGDSEIGTIFKIMKLLGTPTEGTWPGVSELRHWKPTFPQWPVTDLEPLREQRPELGEDGLDLLRRLLRLSPLARITSRRARDHQVFKKYAHVIEASAMDA